MAETISVLTVDVTPLHRTVRAENKHRSHMMFLLNVTSGDTQAQGRGLSVSVSHHQGAALITVQPVCDETVCQSSLVFGGFQRISLHPAEVDSREGPGDKTS